MTDNPTNSALAQAREFKDSAESYLKYCNKSDNPIEDSKAAADAASKFSEQLRDMLHKDRSWAGICQITV